MGFGTDACKNPCTMNIQSIYMQIARTYNDAHVTSMVHTPHIILLWKNVAHNARYHTHQKTCQVSNTPMTMSSV